MTRRRDTSTPEQLLRENDELRARLEEAEETLRAIREGEVDAVIVSGSKGDRVFSLTETENLHRLMVETMSEAGIATSPDGVVLFCNDCACRLLRRTRGQLLGHYLREFTANDDAARLERLLQSTAARIGDDRILFRGADGSAVPMHLWASRLAGAEGPLVCLVGTDLSRLEATQDLVDQLQEQHQELQAEIAVRHVAEEALRRNREWLRVTLTSIGDAVLVTDAAGRITFLNPVGASLTGWTEQEALGEPAGRVCAIIDERTRERAADVVATVLRERRAVGLGNHTALVSRDGREIPIEDSAAPILDSDGEVVGCVLVFHDVTAKRRAQETLRAAERDLRLAVEGAEVGIWSSDPDADVFEASALAKQLLGFDPDEDVRRGEVFARVHPEDRERVAAAARRARAIDEPYSIEYRIERPDGVRWLTSRARPYDEEGVRRVRGVLFDVTRRKNAEEAVRHRVEELRTLMDITPTAICIAEDSLCATITGNRAARQLYEAAENENLSAADNRSRRFFRNGRELAPDELPMQVAAATRREVRETELEVLLPSGRRITVWGHATPLFDSNGDVRGCIGAYADVTERKRVERALQAARDSAERAKADAETANRAKDRFLAVLSHELRTPLAPVLTGISLLEMEPPASEHTRENLDIIRRNVLLESRLIDDLLDLTRISQGRMELTRGLVELSTIVERAVEVCRSDIDARRLHFEMDWAIRPCPVDADAARLEQVLWNLLKNAIKFTPQGGRVAIRGREDNGQAVVEVDDTGIGIEPRVLPNIFDAFAQAESSLSRRFGGLGLGLTISKALLEMHGGTIEARSEGPAKGATFTIRLPLARAPEAAGADAGGPHGRVGSAEKKLRILLVEDHGDTALMTAKLLALDGHEVQTAGDVATALEALEQGRFDLLISDLGLPDGSGLDVMRNIRARGRALPAIALTGYGQPLDVERSRSAGFQLHLVKPVEPGRLLEAIQAIARDVRRM